MSKRTASQAGSPRGLADSEKVTDRSKLLLPDKQRILKTERQDAAVPERVNLGGWKSSLLEIISSRAECNDMQKEPGNVISISICLHTKN